MNNYLQIFKSIDFYIEEYEKYPLCMTNTDGSDRGNITWDDLLGFEHDGRNLSLKHAKWNTVNFEQAGLKNKQNIYACPEDLDLDDNPNRPTRSYSLNINQYFSLKKGISNAWDVGRRWSAGVYDIHKPSETILMTERQHGFLGSIAYSGISSPKHQDPIHGSHNEEFIYLFTDGHSNAYLPIETFNQAMSITVAGKFWTRDPDD